MASTSSLLSVAPGTEDGEMDISVTLRPRPTCALLPSHLYLQWISSWPASLSEEWSVFSALPVSYSASPLASPNKKKVTALEIWEKYVLFLEQILQLVAIWGCVMSKSFSNLTNESGFPAYMHITLIASIFFLFFTLSRRKNSPVASSLSTCREEPELHQQNKRAGAILRCFFFGNCPYWRTELE